MSEIVFFLEEASAEAFLDGLLPRILPEGVTYRCVVFEGKQDLEKQLERRMRGYRVPNARFLVLRDQDAADCKVVKRKLKSICKKAGHPEAVVRIACHELEAFYLADLEAVEVGLQLNSVARHQEKRLFKHPDSFPSPSQTLKNVAHSYQKVGGSRAIAPHLKLDNRGSKSFAHLVASVRNLAGVSAA